MCFDVFGMIDTINTFDDIVFDVWWQWIIDYYLINKIMNIVSKVNQEIVLLPFIDCLIGPIQKDVFTFA